MLTNDNDQVKGREGDGQEGEHKRLLQEEVNT